MFQRLTFCVILFLFTLEVCAQFPAFYPTYKEFYQLKSKESKYPKELQGSIEVFLNSIGKDSLAINVGAASGMAKILKSRNEGLELEVESLELQIKNLSINKIPSSVEVIQAVDWQSQILAKNKEIDTNKVLIAYFQSINSYYGKPEMPFRFVPIRNRYQGNFFYNNVSSSGISTLNSFVIQASENGGAANTEIVSGQIAAVRVSFSSVIQGGGQAIDSLEVNTKLFTGGGISNLHFEYPVFYYNRRNILFYSAFKPGFVADIPVFGSDIERDSFSGYADLAGEFLAELRTDGGEFSFFANFKGSYIVGTPTFYSTLKSPDSNAPLGQVDRPFWISQVYVGVSVSKRFRISANIPIATTRQIQLPDKIQVGLQITPDKNK
jgi:hypothetical protein